MIHSTNCSRRITRALYPLFLLVFLFAACKQPPKEIVPPAAFAAYISAYTGGVISPSSVIRIELTHELPVVEVGSDLKDSPFSFSPAISGKARWTSGSTIEFTPDEGQLKAGTLYNASFKLGDFSPVDKAFSRFDFSFRVEEENNEAADLHADTVVVGIPPVDGSFSLLSGRRIANPENGIELTFSQPLSTTQNMKGLLEISEVPGAVLQLKEEKAYLYFDAYHGPLTVKVDQAVTNRTGNKLGTSHTLSFDQEAFKPQVTIATDAAILPDSKSLLIPFRAVNLYAVDLHILRIYQSNVLRFFQVNNLASENELRRFGRLIYKKRLVLAKEGGKNIHQWQDYSIDLAGLISQEPGAIYRIILSFNQSYSAYPCNEGTAPSFADDLRQVGEGNALTIDDLSDWDEPSAYFNYYGDIRYDWQHYNWQQRNNPCDPTYYMLAERAATCNVLASNLGLIAKQNSMGELWVAVTNLLTTEPKAGAHVTVYNYQLQPIATARTDANGFARLTTTGSTPFLVVAEADGQKSYVRTVEGEEQSLSRFEVGGKAAQKGLKGYIYGERGVWRPGDTLHLTFVLADRERRIPARHPVSLELYNPQGQFYTKKLSTEGTDGFYVFSLATRQEDPTGLWNAYIKVGGATFHKSLHIETIKPNRLKINLTLPRRLEGARQLTVPLAASWLTGAVARGLKSDVALKLTRVATQFKNYAGYLFNDPTSEFTSVKSDLFKGTTDNEGHATFNIELPQADAAPGMLEATFTTRVYEPGGDASIWVQSVPFSPFSSYVGIRFDGDKQETFETDQDHLFNIVTLDADGKPVDRQVAYKIYRIDWNWWWEHRGVSMSSYVNDQSVKPISEGTLRTSGGRAALKFRINYPDWGRYLVYVKDTQSGHASGGTVYVDWPQWRGRAARQDPQGVKQLSFSLDKESYRVGETATAVIPAAAGGRALLSLENGSTVFKQEWIDVASGQPTRYSFSVTAEMTPNVYLYITLLQPHEQTANDLPVRMYGVMPVPVTDTQTILQPRIAMPEVLRPQTDFTLSISEQSGKPMTYTLAIVDEGLLDLSNFRTPNPWDEFYAREALGIRTYDLFDHVLGSFAGRYGSLFGTGGDESLKPADAKTQRFHPVVKFIGPVHLAAGGRQEHTLSLPMYVGSVRVMVVAGSEEGAYGNAQKSAPVRTPLMLLSTLPRVLSVDEEIALPVNVFAMENEVKQVSVSVSTEGNVLQVVGEKTKQLTFAQQGDQLLRFRLKSGTKTGKSVITLTASGGGHQSKERIELEVRNPNPPVTLRSNGWVEAGQNLTLSSPAGNTLLSGDSLTLEVTRIPPLDFHRRLDFLEHYTYDCTEQLTSKALPLLYVSRFKEVSGAEALNLKININEAIARLYGRQHPSGGFVYWPADASANDWVSSYAGLFLVLAAENGYSVQSSVLAKWKNFQRTAAQSWRNPNRPGSYADFVQAFRLYTLAIAGAPQSGAMNRLKEQPDLSLQARWLLAATYAIDGKQEAAAQLIYGQAQTVGDYSSYNAVFGSALRDEALILEALLRMKRITEARQQAARLSTRLNAERSFTTQSTAFAIMAMAGLAEQLSGNLDFTWKWNNQPQTEVKSAKALYTHTLTANDGKGTVEIHNQGAGSISVDLIIQQQVMRDTLPTINNNLTLQVAYALLDGTPVQPERLAQGTDFEAHLTVSAPATAPNYTNLALTHLIPSGWEIFNERFFGDGQATRQNFTYQNIRDDRVLTYFDLPRGTSKLFVVRLQAAYAGNFVLPAIRCEAMYDPTVQARTKARRTVVE
ncbi:MAG: alpha-2-macroglobulin [Prevotellaceae bacterium]|jgi:uncharacterized protein YfaS (alpha-2-macroglobulin family)|nr:alpha-2-macroglobulin [Prevotellaceae bacterium]